MLPHTLEHLALAAPAGRRLVVLGDPVAHSLSPAMHNAALAEMARQWPELAQWRYEAVHVPAGELPRALAVLHAAGVAGINLTLPHKVDALALVAEADATARAMGAVNTLVRTPGGYRGTNTDGYGIVQALAECFQRSLAGADVWLFGAGGAARGIAVACLQAGCRRLTVVNRGLERLRALEQQLRSQPGLAGGRCRFFQPEGAPDRPGTGAILINATSLGLKATDPSPVDPAWLRPDLVVYDTTYGARNALAAACAAAAAPYADGLAMLAWQGARSLEIWTGRPAPAATMRRAAEQELAARAKR